tara:strand:- start:2095 stop:2634 length:540 start_codon:yes stop_codon:yes gene_type:complete
MKKNLIISCIIFFIVNSVCAADLKFKLSGKDEYPFFEKYGENGNSMFMLYKNEAQFTTNTTLFGTHVAGAVIEMINGKQTQNLFGVFTDSYKNKGYVKSVPTTEKEIKGNMLGDRIGTSIGSFKFVDGEGPWKYLIGTVVTGVYYSMGDGHWLWQGSIKNLPDDIIKKIDGYLPEDKKS